MNNIQRAKAVLQGLLDLGVTDFCICSGARNGPLVYILEEALGIKIFSFFDERSASFFGLGRILATGKPVCVVTTSGTAVGELLPACIEAYYQALPLVLLTADRPFNYRGSGAPQAINQQNIFGTYATRFLDCDVNMSQFSEINELPNHERTWNGPIHINIAFSEPLIDDEIPELWAPSGKVKPEAIEPSLPRTLGEVLNNGTEMHSSAIECIRPLVMVTGLTAQEANGVLPHLLRWNVPLVLEGTSQLTSSPAVGLATLDTPKQLLRRFATGEFQSVIRIGGIPTHRLWRDLDLSLKDIEVLSFSARAFSGLARHTRFLGALKQLVHVQIQSMPAAGKPISTSIHSNAPTANLERCLRAHELAETSLLEELLRKIKSNDTLFVGNSLPVRQVDLLAPFVRLPCRVLANRGANGIDGQVSTYLGSIPFGNDDQATHWGIFGDLTTLYDLQAPWILSQLPKARRRIVVINNQGGQIFSRIFPRPTFLNAHNIEFAAWAQLWQCAFASASSKAELRQVLQESAHLENLILELRPDPTETQEFWSDFES